MIVDREDAVRVKTIIAMGHGLGLEVIAQGIEDWERFDQLKQDGCDLIQGYFFSLRRSSRGPPRRLRERLKLVGLPSV
jgi:EAL domain-containing protein (putative c-di-GMP-specific phosphodiesterase class I)